MSSALFALWFATIGADRLDLLAGEGWIMLSAALLLTPLVIALETLRLVREGGRFRVPRNAVAYAVVSSALLAVVLVSVLYSFDISMSAKRYVLLAFQVYTTLLVVVALAQRSNAREILVRGAYWGIVLGTVSNIFQLATWFIHGAGTLRFLGGTLDMTLNVYGSWFPRLSAQAMDMNRGGILLLVYTYLLARLAPRSRMRTVLMTAGVLGMILTLSRSMMLGVFGTGVALLLSGRRFSFTPRRALAGAVMTAVFCMGLIASPRAASAVGEALSPVLERFSVREGSANVHLELIWRGIEIATDSPKNALIGVGYGNSFAYLQDFFPGDKHGNFHSLYLTLLAECGALALLLGVALLAFATFHGGVYQPLIAGFAFFNIFYQTSAEAIFWFAIALAWTRVGDPAVEPAPAPAPPAVPPPRHAGGRSRVAQLRP